ncbi:MAG: FadR family transcriptional regulator [Syntrophorhabdaceae bacterium]|nr:FadR family transcriptional regulator [Syntrophorhabdaceae bacterium]
MALLKPAKKVRVYEEVVAKIKEMIDKGRLKSGDQLPVERELAEVFRVSRSSVREAIRSLESQGLLESRQGDGTYIARHPVELLVNPLASVICSQKDGQEELFEMRRLIEPQLAFLAAERATDEEIVQMEKTLSLQKQQVLRGESGAEADKQFHYLLANAARNRFLLQIVDSNMGFFMESRDNFLQVEGRPKKSVQRHRELLDAIEVRDSEGAAQAMREHLLDIENSLFEIAVEKAGGNKQVS